MADLLSSDERFRHSDMLHLIYDGKRLPVADNNERIVTIYDADLDVSQAKALRDWLTSILPKESQDETSGWRPIETAPMDGTAILTLRGNEKTISRYAVAFWSVEYGVGSWAMCCGPRLLQVTHWMPLPSPAVETKAPLEDADDREPMAEGDARYYRPSEKAKENLGPSEAPAGVGVIDLAGRSPGVSVCPYCQHVNGGHSLACSALNGNGDAC